LSGARGCRASRRRRVFATELSTETFRSAHEHVRKHARWTPLISSRSLSDECRCKVLLKAESFQRTGSYKIRGPLNKFAHLSKEEKAAGVICSSAGNHAQGVALAAALHGLRAVVVMAENATPAKIEATRGYGAEVVLYGSIWDEANEKALELVESDGLTYIHPFDDLELIAGQGTVGLEIYDDLVSVDTVVVPIGGGGLISGVASALKSLNPKVRVIGVESSDAPAMQRSVAAGRRVELEEVTCSIDGLKVKRVGENTLDIVSRVVDDIVSLPDEQIFEALLWTLTRTKIVVEGAAAAPVAALLNGLVEVPPSSEVVCVLSGGNIDIDQLRGLTWN
jgi:threonine dehydratase